MPYVRLSEKTLARKRKEAYKLALTQGAFIHLRERGGAHLVVCTGNGCEQVAYANTSCPRCERTFVHPPAPQVQ